MRCRAIRTIARLLLCALCLGAPASTPALERLQRRFGPEQGLPFSEIFSLAQDQRGFIWLATAGGLLRYDGVEMRPWPAHGPRSTLISVAVGPTGEILATDYFSRLYEVTAESLEPVGGPDGRQMEASWRPSWDGAGRLWIVSDHRLWMRSGGGAWTEFPPGRLGGQSPSGVTQGARGSLLVITPDGIWRVSADLSSAPLAAMGQTSLALERADGAIAVLTRDGRVLEVRDGVARELHRDSARPIAMVERRGTLWVSYDTGLVRLSPGEPAERLGAAEEIPGGGSLLVDHEDSLWLGTYRGLRQLPAPETVAWGMADGLRTDGVRRLALTAEGIWVDTWIGLSLMRRSGNQIRPEPIADTGTAALCTTTDGTLWTGSRGRLQERRAGAFVEHAPPGFGWLRACAAGPGGRVWLAGGGRLTLAAPPAGQGDTRLRDVAWPASITGQANTLALLEDAAGRLWIAEEDRICHAEAAPIASGREAHWTCATMTGSGGIFDLEVLPSGSIWAATAIGGVFAWSPAGDVWRQLPATLQLPSRSIRKVRASLTGGAWIISYGTIVRVAERPDLAAGWEVVERPSAWQGLMISDAEDILEDGAGDLWLTTLAGLVHVPAAVRVVPGVPAVELVDVMQDGARLAWSEPLRLPWSRNRLELRVAALTFRDPGLLRYQLRLNPGEAWVEAAGPPTLRFVNLPPGAHRLEVRASLDGTRWSAAPAGISFVVDPPFWRTWWFISLAVLGVAAAAVMLHRQRVARLLALERVRTRIATDLHDEVGAGLSEIALMGELWSRQEAARPGDGLPARIAATSRRLVDSMSDIVWAIDPEKDHVFSLSQRMRRFATSFLRSAGVALRFESIDESHDQALDGDARRELLLAFQEIIHNCVKHSRCTTVDVRLGIEGGSLLMLVADDGAGFEPGRIEEGTGLSSLRRRAARLRGTCLVDSRPGSGTRITIQIPMEPRGRPSPIREGHRAPTGDKIPS